MVFWYISTMLWFAIGRWLGRRLRATETILQQEAPRRKCVSTASTLLRGPTPNWPRSQNGKREFNRAFPLGNVAERAQALNKKIDLILLHINQRNGVFVDKNLNATQLGR